MPGQARANVALARWLDCRRCKLHAFRRHVVLGRGAIPAPLLFVGMGPGKSEDLVGEAFVGPSGRLLKIAVDDARATVALEEPPEHYLTNLIACRPCDEPSGPNRDPETDEIMACRPRFAETVALIRPERVVFLGDLAETEGRAVCPDGVKLRHPAFLSRVGGRGTPEYRRFVRQLGDVFLDLAMG